MTDMLPVKLRAHIIKIQRKKYRKLYNEFIVEGLKGAQEAINENAKIHFIVVAKDYLEKNKIKNFIYSAQRKRINVYACGKNDISKIKTTATYPGISAIVKAEEFEMSNLINNKPILAFDKINDPGNLGTIIRTAKWFGVDNILLSEDSVEPYNDKCVRSTMGAIFKIKFYHSKNFIKSIAELKDKGYKIVLLDIKGDDIRLMKSTPKTVYLFGSESHGIRQSLEEFDHKRYTIKGKGDVESLNISVAVGILLSEIN